jgi:hypothetical protein
MADLLEKLYPIQMSRRWKDMGDGTFAEVVYVGNEASGGGGASTIADGADIALGTTTDTPASSTVAETATARTGISLLKGIKNVLLLLSACITGNKLQCDIATLPDITVVSPTTLHAVVAASADATTAIVAADVTHKIRVIQYTVIGHGAGSFEWKSATTAKSGAMDYVVASGASPYCPEGLIETAVNEALNLTTVTGAANGHISYQLV